MYLYSTINWYDAFDDKKAEFAYNVLENQIEDTFEKKVEALFCHRSQMGDPSDESRVARMRQRYEEMGKRIGAPLAESFKRVELFR